MKQAILILCLLLSVVTPVLADSLDDHIAEVLSAYYSTEPEPVEEKSFYDLAMEESKKFIWGFEGVRLKAYPDGKLPNGEIRWSIGYGTISYEGETITADEAWTRGTDAISSRLDNVIKIFPGHNLNQTVALTSYLYNCPKVYYLMVNNGISEDLWKSCKYYRGKVAGGLLKRRAAEWELFNR